MKLVLLIKPEERHFRVARDRRPGIGIAAAASVARQRAGWLQAVLPEYRRERLRGGHDDRMGTGTPVGRVKFDDQVFHLNRYAHRGRDVVFAFRLDSWGEDGVANGERCGMVDGRARAWLPVLGLGAGAWFGRLGSMEAVCRGFAGARSRSSRFLSSSR